MELEYTSHTSDGVKFLYINLLAKEAPLAAAIMSQLLGASNKARPGH